jgi:hypothetical protein
MGGGEDVKTAVGVVFRGLGLDELAIDPKLVIRPKASLDAPPAQGGNEAGNAADTEDHGEESKNHRIHDNTSCMFIVP